MILCRCQTSSEYNTKHKNERRQKNFELELSLLLFASNCQNQMVEAKFWIKSAKTTQMWIRLINDFEHENGNVQSMGMGKHPSTRKWNLAVFKISISLDFSWRSEREILTNWMVVNDERWIYRKQFIDSSGYNLDVENWGSHHWCWGVRWHLWCSYFIRYRY